MTTYDGSGELDADDMIVDTHRTMAAATDAQRIMDALRRIVRELRVADHSSTTYLGVSAAQLFVLRNLCAHPSQSLGELAKCTRTSQSSVSEVVTRLVARGLVSRESSPADRRRVELSITARGRSVATRASLTIQERLLAGLENLEATQRCKLAEGMAAWLSAAGLADVPPSMFFEP